MPILFAIRATVRPAWAADDADEFSDDDANSAGGRGIGTLIAALGLLVLGGGGATAVGVKVLRDRD